VFEPSAVPRLFTVFFLLILGRAEAVFQIPKSPSSEGFRGYQEANRAGITWEKVIPKKFQRPSQELGLENVRDQKIRHIKFREQQIIWDASYEFDASGNRLTWANLKVKPSAFVYFAGCSVTFGLGLNQDETFPDIVAHVLPDFRIYNAAISGGSPSQLIPLIDRLDSGFLTDSRQGLFVYTYISDHIVRSNGLSPWTEKMKSFPNYEEVGGDMVLDRTLGDAHPFRNFFYRWAGKIFFPGKIFPAVSPAHVAYTCSLIQKAKRRFEQKFSRGIFIALEHPLDKNSELTECLKKKNIDVVASSFEEQRGDRISGDVHPSASFNRRWSSVLVDQLRPYLKRLSGQKLLGSQEAE
jgi:hypothetical protein